MPFGNKSPQLWLKTVTAREVVEDLTEAFVVVVVAVDVAETPNIVAAIVVEE